MSGNGGGGGNYGGGSPSFDCNSLVMNTQLASPIPAVIATLVKGDVLDVVLVSTTGPVQAVTSAGVVAGAILTTGIGQLIQCISDGHQFIAKVLDIKGGNCQVLITHI